MNRFHVAILAVVLAALTSACGSRPASSPAPASGGAAPSHDDAAHAHPHGDEAHSHGEADHAHPEGGAAHSDHEARHGGTFFMAPNGWHHLEGTLPAEGLFRVWLYDDFTRHIDAKTIAGHVRRDQDAEDVRIPLEYEPSTEALVARLDPAPPLPLDLVLFLTLTEPTSGETKEHRFDFRFDQVSSLHAAPGETHSHASPHGGQVVTVGEDLHFELGIMGGVPALWILDVNLATLPVADKTAALIVQVAGSPTRTVELLPMGDHFMAAGAVDFGASATVVAQVTIDGRARIGRFIVAQ